MGSQVTEVKGAAQKQGDKKQEVFQSAAFYDRISRGYGEMFSMSSSAV